MESDLCEKLEKFLSNPCHSTWADVPVPRTSCTDETFFRDQASLVVDRQRDSNTLIAASAHLLTILDFERNLPAPNQVVLAWISGLRWLVEARLEVLRKEEAAREEEASREEAAREEAASEEESWIDHRRLRSNKILYLVLGGVLLVGLGIYAFYRFVKSVVESN